MTCARVKPLAAGAVDCHVVPLEVNTLPEVPGATTCTAEVPLPKMTLLAVKDVAPVPPLATLKVPANVIEPVVPVLGVKPVVPALKDVTPPVDAAHVAVVPLDVNT